MISVKVVIFNAFHPRIRELARLLVCQSAHAAARACVSVSFPVLLPDPCLSLVFPARCSCPASLAQREDGGRQASERRRTRGTARHAAGAEGVGDTLRTHSLRTCSPSARRTTTHTHTAKAPHSPIESRTQMSAAATAADVASKKRKADDTNSSTAAVASATHDASRSSDDDDSGANESEQRAKKSKNETATDAGAAAASSDSSDDDDEDAELDARPSFGGGRGLSLGASASSAAAASSSAAGSSAAASAAVAPSILSSAAGSSALGARLLALAGYKGSGGLGKHGTGRLEPVRSSTQVSKEGIGFEAAVQRREHSFEAFEVEVELKPLWITQDTASASQPLPSLETMRSSWATLGPRDPSVLSDARYCALDVQDALLAAKSAFDGIPSLQFRQARERSNPFERIRGEFFQNRAALKMAEMDAMCGRIFTQPPSTRNILGQPPKKREIIQVGDVCAGPGGFSEFMLTVLKWRCSVHGFTLRGPNDFNTGKFNRNAPTHSFHAWYGVDNTGDITSNANMRDYTLQVDAATKGKGLHVMMADGGFSVVGRENMRQKHNTHEHAQHCVSLCPFLSSSLLLTLFPSPPLPISAPAHEQR